MASTHTVYFATNRHPKRLSSTDPEDLTGDFNHDKPYAFRIGSATATLSGSNPLKDSAWSFKSYDLARERLRQSSPELGSDKILPEIREHLKETKSDVMIFLHGFANDFENSILRAAQLQQVYSTADRPLTVFLFAWPSDGESALVRPYFNDRIDAKASGEAMGRALKRFVQFLREMLMEDERTIREARVNGTELTDDMLVACDRKVHLMAHSMGNWALRWAMKAYNELTSRRFPQIFEHVFLMAADEDANALSDDSKLGCLTELGEQIHVYHAKDDRALMISDETKGNPDRLGSRGPEDWLLLPENIFAVDCADVSDTTIVDARHQYYRARSEVITDVQMTLAGQGPEGRKGRKEIRPGRAWRLIEA